MTATSIVMHDEYRLSLATRENREAAQRSSKQRSIPSTAHPL
jgi:hypothetical protein